MGKRVYTIGFFTSDYNRGLVSVVLDSLMEYRRLYDNLRIRVFDCFGNTIGKAGDSPVSEIYELPDLNDFDGVIVQSHQIISESALASLGKRIRRTGIPAVSIGDFMEGCCRINTDDYSAFRDITEHLISVHNAGSFLFIKGVERKGKDEAMARRRGFEDVCREHGISPDNISYAEGSWMNKDGKRAVADLLKSGRPLPDAIVAANDEMALGAMSSLKEAGYRVPEDVMITGYDDIFRASLSNPRLTTVRRDFKTLVFTAMDTLRKIVKYDETLPDVIYSPYQMVPGGTCGCPGSADLELASIKKSYYSHIRDLTVFYTRQDKITSELFHSDTPEKLLDVLERNSSAFGGGDLFIAANDFYHESLFHGDSDRLGSPGNERHYSQSFVLTACSGPLRGSFKDTHIYCRFTRAQLMKLPVWKDEPFLLFYPLHFENLLMGFLVLTSPPTSSSQSNHEIALHLFEFAIETIRQKLIARNLNERLDILYITDPLSGLYNRFGYERLAGDLFRNIRAKGAQIHVLFIDIDNMKQINDTHGHDDGDRAIVTIAEAIRTSCRPEDFKMRYGGDEFVVITEKEGSSLETRIRENLRIAAEKKNFPFELTVSIGEYCGNVGPDDTPDSFLDYADRQMYREKNVKKSRGQS